MTSTRGERIGKTMDGMGQDLPASENIVRALGELHAERARFKSELPRLANPSILPPDPFRFRQGVPLVAAESLVDLAASWQTAGRAPDSCHGKRVSQDQDQPRSPTAGPGIRQPGPASLYARPAAR